MQPWTWSHNSFKQEHVDWHSSPYAGNSHGKTQLGPLNPIWHAIMIELINRIKHQRLTIFPYDRSIGVQFNSYKNDMIWTIILSFVYAQKVYFYSTKPHKNVQETLKLENKK